jgi:hypothetical protein
MMLRAAITLYEGLLGCALLFAPWTRVWQENWLFWQAGDLQTFLMSGPVRGAVSGLGAAFVIRAAGRLAGIAMVDGDDDAPQGPWAPRASGTGHLEATGEGTAAPPRAREEEPRLNAGGAEARGVAPAGIRER